nr:hypothetical protein [bacterium]
NENQDILNKLKNQIANVLQCRNNEERKLIYNHCFKLQHERFKPIYDCMRVKKEYAENIINQFSIGRDDFKLATLDNLFFSGIFLTEPDIKLDIKQPEIENIQDVSAVNTTENNLNFNKQKNTINLRNFELDKWKNLIITLLDDRRIDIYINKKPHTQYTANYEELGFKMKKSNKPILSWYLFYLFKKNQALSLNIIDELNKKNLIDNSINYLTLRDNLKQYIKDFKKKLNQIFICKDEFEPISYDKKTKKYLLNFKIQ